LLHALSLYRCENFTRAADAVAISQSALSRSIRSLEEELDITLFDRDATRVTPTRFGEVFLRRAEEIVVEFDDLQREMRLMRGLSTGNLAIAMGVYPAAVSGNRALGEMVGAHPNLRFRSHVGNWETVSEHVRSRAVDLGFAAVSENQIDERLLFEAVSEHEMVLYCRSTHPLAGSSSLSRSDLDTFPLVSIRVPGAYADVVPGSAKQVLRSGDLIPAVEIDDFASAQEVVRNSDALGAAIPLQIEAQLNSGELKLLDFPRPWLSPVHAFIRLKNRTLSPAAAAFMDRVLVLEEKAKDTNARVIDQHFP